VLPYQDYAGLIKKAKDMPDFLDQDRPAKVKEIYKALKRDHPDMPAEKKARIAARQGKKGKQHQGPPYKGPITKSAESLTSKKKRLKEMIWKSENPTRYGMYAGGLLGAAVGSKLGSKSLKTGNRLGMFGAAVSIPTGMWAGAATGRAYEKMSPKYQKMKDKWRKLSDEIKRDKLNKAAGENKELKKIYYYKGGKRRGYYPKPEGLRIPPGNRW
jgi:hypothetical protein